MTILHQLTCAYPGCVITFKARRHDAKFCPKHKDPKNLQRDLRRLESAGPEGQAEAHEVRLAASMPDGLGAAEPALRIATALCLGASESLALALAGFDSEAPSVPRVELLAEARAKYPALAAGDSRAFQGLLRMGIGQAVVGLLSSMGSMPGSQTAAALKSATQALELLQQGAGKVHTQCFVNIHLVPV